MSTVNDILGEAEVPEFEVATVDREDSDSTDSLVSTITQMVSRGYRYFYSRWTGQDSVDMVVATKTPLDEAGVERVFDAAEAETRGDADDDDDIGDE
jgi:hypothetical protein